MVSRSGQAAIPVLEQDPDTAARCIAFRRSDLGPRCILLARSDAPRVVASLAVLRQQHRPYAAAPQCRRRLITEHRLARLPALLPGRELARQSSCEALVGPFRLEALADRFRLVRDRNAGERRPGNE